MNARQNHFLAKLWSSWNISLHRSCILSLYEAQVIRRFGSLLVLLAAGALARTSSGATALLATLEYRITGTSLQVTPAIVSVPKGIAGSVLVSVVSGGSTNNVASAQLSAGAYIEAILRGPAFPEPRRLVAPPNTPLLFPPINLVGDYQLDGIRLVDAATGQTRMEASPSSVPVHVFDEVLVSRVTSRPLTLQEIQDKGIVIDDSNFRAVEFDVAFVLEGKTIPVQFPVVAPKFKDSTELVPAAELEARLKEAAVLNRQIASEVVQLPPELETAKLNIQIQPVNFQVVEEGGVQSLALTIPPIPALMVIPGNIGFLHQFFSVQIFTENGAPTGSGLSVSNVQAQLILPPGPDRIVSTNYTQPGDDPLRFARIGPNKIIQPIQTIVKPGPDGAFGTADDVGRLFAGESGQAEFLVEGLQEGLHVIDLDLTADLEGLAAGTVKVMGKAAGSVLVRNPRFSFAFAHPRTVRTGEPYEASITILNTGITPANLVSVTLNRNSISGAVLESSQGETVQLGTILPGQTATAKYRLRAQRTGAISFSNLSTSDDSTVGRFRFSMGIDERGIALSPDTLALPDFVNYLPPDVLAAANRVLGQALSVATAGQLPAGVQPVPKSVITKRVLELAEAGQRLRYGDPLNRVLPDLLRDWQGGRLTNAGFDQILRETDAGAEWRAAIFGAMEATDHFTGTERLLDRAADLAGLGQNFVLASANLGQLQAAFDASTLQLFSASTNVATTDHSTQPFALIYPGTNGLWAVTPELTNAVFFWTFTNGPPMADMAVLIVGTNGQARRLRWVVSNPPTNAVYRFALSDPTSQLQVDLGGDGSIDSFLSPSQRIVSELPPTLIAVEQDLTVLSGRPPNPCGGPPYLNYGTVVAVVFSKPITQTTAGLPDSYMLDGDNGANSVQVQPSGRVALLNLRKGISAIRPRTLAVTNVTDVRGNAVVGGVRPVHSVYPNTDLPFTGGVAVRGRVLRGDGSFAAGAPVTLTMYDKVPATFGSCDPWIRRVSQVLTDSGGNFDFDFVMSGIPYSVSATDTSGLTDDAIRLIMESTVQDSVDRQRIEQLASSPETSNTLLGALAASSLPEAIAKVEGLDRALVRDFVQIGSSREGQTVPFALRFRGRATVIGQVVAADGATPVPNAAVNLFPDPDSRELGRGIFADASGQFAFFGVPLGVFTVDVQTSDMRARTVAGLLNVPGQVTNIVIALPSTAMPFGTLRGQVFEADNLTPHGNGRIFIGQFNGATGVRDVVRIVEADADGFWEAADIPVHAYDIVAVTFDSKRKGVRRDITPVANSVTYANVTLEAVTRVFGRVQFDDGRPATNALVAGGVALVRADALGKFELKGVPIGDREISAGLERNPAAGIDFPRLGTVRANIIAGANNYVVVKLRPAGRIFGRVVNAQGQPQPNIRVAIPQQGGFYWTDADSAGNYVFENLAPANYTVSAPANAVAPQINESELIAQIRSGDEDQILAAFEEAVRVFVGAEDPLITGEHANFRPSSWGYTTTRIRFDGDNVNADIRFIVQGTVSGKVLNHQGVPIGARVRLTGFGPSQTGAPTTTIRGERDSDPATGEFVFPNQLLAGPWGLQAASPFYPVVLMKSGFTTEIDPDATNIVLQFPPAREVNGRIAGRVLYADGKLVGGGVKVKINISADYEIQTDTNGVFDTQIALPALGRSYLVEAFDPVTGLRGRAGVNMTPGITNLVDVHLLTRNSTIQVTVLRGNGQPAVGALVELDHGSYPNEAPLSANANTNGVATFSGLWEGNYAVMAQYAEAATRVFARAGATVGPNETKSLTLRLGATGSIRGTFVKRDFVTPVIGAQVAIGNLGFANTDTNGFFRFDGVPLGTHQIVSSDPVTGAAANTSVSLTYADQVQTVTLVETLRGEINGLVLDSFNGAFVAGATVRINFSDGLTPSRTVTTGPDGRFAFPGSPVGAFSLNANYQLPGTERFTVAGQASGVLTEATPTVSVDIQLQPLAVLPVRIVRNDGTTPASNTRVVLSGVEQDTSATGMALFNNLRLMTYSLQAISRNGGELHNGTQVSVNVATRGTNPVFTVVLPGIGRVRGSVVGSDGATPVQNAEIKLVTQGAPFAGEMRTALTDAQGRFLFDDVPVGPYLVSAASQSLAASVNGTISAANETDDVALRLGASGTLLGRIVRADGTNPVNGIDVVIDYASQSVNPGRAFFRTGADGAFRFDNIPVGAIHVSSVAPTFGGIIDFNAALTTNGQVLNLGDIRFDEDLPAIGQVIPADTAIGVPIRTTVELLFSEALATDSIKTNGIFIRGMSGTVASTVTLLPTNGVPRLVRIAPLAPLLSEHAYEVIVLSGDLPGPSGGIIGSGPRDLVGRALAAPFVSRFTTADNDPPVLLSLFPSNNAVQIDPRAVPRLSFNETLRSTGFFFRVTGPGGAIVPGAAEVGVNGQVLSFVPTGELQPNARYSLTVSNVFDLAGNRAAGEPFVASFATLDTIGPTIATLRIASNAVPVSGGAVTVEALLAGTNEPGASVRFTQDFNPMGTDTNAPFQIAVALPLTGSTTIRAIATDQFGNDGPVAELAITVQPRQPPTIQLTRVSPASGPAPSGSLVVVDVTASGTSGPFQISAIVGGAATGTLTTTNGTRLRVQGVVPATATSNQQVQVLAQATDSLGESSGQQILNIPVSDGTLPVLEILSPTNNARLPSGQPLNLAVVTWDNSSNVTLRLTISGNLTATQTVGLALTPNTPTTNVLTVPLTGAPTNGGLITATLTAMDGASNSVTLARIFSLPGTIGPAIATLQIASNAPPVAGSTVFVEAVLAANQPGTSVRFTQGANAVGTATNPPYQARVTLPLNGGTTIRAIATDALGFDGPAAQLVITVQTNTLPTIQFVRVSPASGPVLSGSPFVVDVIASGNSNLFLITATLGGAATSATVMTNGTVLRVQGFVPATALAGQQARITAQAVDGLGQSSGPQVLSLSVSDGSPPMLTILSPPEGAQLPPGQSLSLTTRVTDNSAGVTLGVVISGAVSATQSLALVLTPNTPVTNVFTVPLPGAPTNGSPIMAMLTATDAANNTTTLARIFWLPGTETTVTWNRQALGQVFTCVNNGRQYSWPNNNNWSQSVLFADPCSAGTNVVIAPSNWSRTNYPNGTNLDVILGGLGGAPANLDVPVSLHSLTIQAAGGLNLPSPGVGSFLSAVNFFFEGASGITRSSCCGPTTLVLNGGSMAKTAGTDTFTIHPEIVLNSFGGTLAVDTGALALPGNNSFYTNGAFNVAANATLLLVPAGHNASFAGTFTGSGAGAAMLNAGTLNAGSGGVTFNVPEPVFQWTGGTISGGNPMTNAGAIRLAGTNGVLLVQTLNNAGLFRHAGAGNLQLYSPGAGASFENLASGVYWLESNGGISVVSCCGPTIFDNAGLFRKSGGVNESRIDSVAFRNLGGIIDVQTGRLTLANNGSSSNGTFTVVAGAILDLTGGRTPTWAGLVNGTGAGRVELNSGQITATPSLTVDCAPGLFHWTGGTFEGSVTNSNTLAISGASDVFLVGTFANAALLQHSGSSSLALRSPGAGARFVNLAGATYRLETNGSIRVDSCCGPVNFDNFGTFTKAVSSSNAIVSAAFNNVGGLVNVETGTLTLANDGGSANGTYTVSAGARLDVTGGQTPKWSGRMTGRGAGAVVLSSGTLRADPSATLDFTNGLFQWTGATLSGAVSNVNVLTISGTNDHLLIGKFDNLALLRHTGSGRLGFHSPGAGTLFRNFPGATYQFETDSAIYVNSCCGPTVFENAGLVRKIGGASNTTISVSFNNLGGTVEVNAGRLTLGNDGSSSNGTFNLGLGASVDLTGGQRPTWAGRLIGRGAGRIDLHSGTLFAPGLTLDCAPGMFQWSDGDLNGAVTNVNEVTVGLPGGRVVGNFFNAGTVRQTGLANLALNSPGAGSAFRNLPGATYEFTSDGSISVNSCCGPTAFENAGLLRKSGGLTNATISVLFSNQNGSITVDSGTLRLANANYVQGSGALTIKIGGRGAGQFGQLSVSGNATLSGPLNISLASGFTPMNGDQFQILSCASRSGTFSALNVPAGFAVNYSGSGVTLVVTNAALIMAQHASARLAADSLGFSLQSVSNRTYTVERSDDLRSANWAIFTNFTGDGSLMRINVPVTNVPQRFFRVRER